MIRNHKFCAQVIPVDYKKKIKSRFAGFNAQFETLYEAQRYFSVPDSDLRSQLRNDNVELILPKYRALLER